jgi:simple sugar transport system permease protein
LAADAAFWSALALATLRLSLPLILACFGGLMSERAGVANIALESYLLFSAFTAATVAHFTLSPHVGLLAGVAAAGAVGWLFATICVYGRGDQIVVGMAFNFLALGLIPILCRALFGVSGGTPALPVEARFGGIWLFAFLALAYAVYVAWMLRQTPFGLRVHAAGENPVALLNQGVDVHRVRVLAIVQGALIAGVGGACLSLALSSGYARDMSAGRGFIALAALIFGGWRPLPAVLACLAFGFTDAAQIQLQGREIAGVKWPTTLIQTLPYLAALTVLMFSRRRVLAPSAINRDLETFRSN